MHDEAGSLHRANNRRVSFIKQEKLADEKSMPSFYFSSTADSLSLQPSPRDVHDSRQILHIRVQILPAASAA